MHTPSFHPRTDGGTDQLPNRINEHASRPDTDIFTCTVLPNQGTHDHMGPIDGLVCCQRRGEALWVRGLRVREQHRNKGLATALLVRFILFLYTIYVYILTVEGVGGSAGAGAGSRCHNNSSTKHYIMHHSREYNHDSNI